MLAIATGTIGGVLIAVSAQVLLGRVNLEVVSVWHDLLAHSAMQIRSAVAWWLIVAAALAGGFVTSAATRYLLLNWWPLRWLRWIAGAAIVAGLGVIGHMAGEASGPDAVAQVAAGFTSMIVSLVGAMIGAFFAARR
jgi:hypothetical protein